MARKFFLINLFHGSRRPFWDKGGEKFPNRVFNKFIIIVTTSGADFQSMTGGNLSEEGRSKGEEGEGRNSPFILFFYNGFDRTYLRTASTFGTFLFINHIGLALFNGFCGTFFSTCSASHTFIRNHVGHWHHPLYS
jgi:hypothetical protein